MPGAPLADVRIVALEQCKRSVRDGVGCGCDVSLFEEALQGLGYVGTLAATAGYVPPKFREPVRRGSFRGEHALQVLVEVCGYEPARVDELAAGVFGEVAV